MGIYRIPLSGDCFITSESLSGNSGADHVLNVAAKYVENDNKKYISRILGRIDLSTNSDIMSKINSGVLPNPVTNSTVTAKLIMFDCLHSEQQAYSFSIDVFRITSDWNEGTGIGFNEGNDLLMTGFANYMYAKANTFWSTSGGDYAVDATSATQTFDYGNENLSVNLTEMVKGWISNTYSNYGFIVKMSDTDEIQTGSSTSNLNTYRKSFFSRETDLLKWPRVEFTWDDQTKDNRSFFKVGSSGFLYYYNVINGQFLDMNSTNNYPGHVVIEGATSTNSNTWSTVSSSLSALIGTRVKQGVYKITVPELPYSVYPTYAKFRDKWALTGAITAVTTGFSQSFYVASPFDNTFDYIDNSRIVVSAKLNDEYQKGDKSIIRLFIKDTYENINVLTASSTSYTSKVMENGHYRITTDDEVDIDWQPLDFDKNGNFFTLDTNNLTRGCRYKVDFKVNYMNQELYFDGKYMPTKFRIV